MFTVAESWLIFLMKTPRIAVYNLQQETSQRFCETLVGRNVFQMRRNQLMYDFYC